MRKILSILLLFWAYTGSYPAAAATVWQVDPGPSSVQFKVRHLLFSEVIDIRGI